MRRIAAGIAASYDLAVDVAYTREFVPTLNDPAATAAAVAAARTALGADHVSEMGAPMTGSEDFARFLRVAPGCFGFIGNGEGSAPLHNPGFDFNDAAIPAGVGYFTALVRQQLPLSDEIS